MRSAGVFIKLPLVALLCAVIAGPVSAQPKIKPPGAETRDERCEMLLQSAGFDNRYELIGGMTKTTACLMRGLLGQEEFDRELGPRLRLYLELCYSPDEQAYLRQVVQRGIVQAMPYASQSGCDETVTRVLRIRPPQTSDHAVDD